MDTAQGGGVECVGKLQRQIKVVPQGSCRPTGELRDSGETFVQDREWHVDTKGITRWM